MCTRTTGFKENVRTPRRTPPELRSSLRAPHRRARHARYTAATIAAKTTHESKVISLFIYNCRSAISVCRCCHSLARSLTNLKECMLECAYSDEICARKPAGRPGSRRSLSRRRRTAAGPPKKEDLHALVCTLCTPWILAMAPRLCIYIIPMQRDISQFT